MTASDPRVGEIQARLDDHYEEIAYADDIAEGGDEEVPEDYERHYCNEDGEDWPCKTITDAAPADVAYLLAELADRDEKLARVEGAITAVHGEMDGGDLENYCSHDGDEYPCETVTALRAAIAAANGGDA